MLTILASSVCPQLREDELPTGSGYHHHLCNYCSDFWVPTAAASAKMSSGNGCAEL